MTDLLQDKVKEKPKAEVKPLESNSPEKQASDNKNNNGPGNSSPKDGRTSDKEKNKTTGNVNKLKTDTESDATLKETSSPLDQKNIQKKDKQDRESDKDSDQETSKDSEMKRRPSSPPSLSSSFNILPPIKKENEVIIEFKVCLKLSNLCVVFRRTGLLRAMILVKLRILTASVS